MPDLVLPNQGPTVVENRRRLKKVAVVDSDDDDDDNGIKSVNGDSKRVEEMVEAAPKMSKRKRVIDSDDEEEEWNAGGGDGDGADGRKKEEKADEVKPAVAIPKIKLKTKFKIKVKVKKATPVAPAAPVASAVPAAPSSNVNWIQCEKCKKWRKVADFVSMSALPDDWECKLNTWDPVYRDCSVPEEVATKQTPTQQPAPQVQWVQCEKCDKWRTVAAHIPLNSLPSSFVCADNYWDPEKADCAAAEVTYAAVTPTVAPTPATAPAPAPAPAHPCPRLRPHAR